MKIVLLGYMGSGKSSIGNALAKAINQPFVDLDNKIEKDEQCTITDIFNNKGEIYFRKLERETLERLVKADKKMVVSLGGGTPCLGNTMEFLNVDNEVITIYLKASNAVLTNRLFEDKEKRPLINHLHSKENLNDFIRKHLFERAFYYNQAKKIVVVDDKDISQIVEEIVALLY